MVRRRRPHPFFPSYRVGQQTKLAGLFLAELRHLAFPAVMDVQAGAPMTVQVMTQARRDAPAGPSLFSGLHQQAQSLSHKIM
jgi:hypothetical protein